MEVIRTYLTTEQARCVVHAYVTSRLDQNNSLLCGVSETRILSKLQRVQNAAARLILGGMRQDHVTPLLRELHTAHSLQNHTLSVQDIAGRWPSLSP